MIFGIKFNSLLKNFRDKDFRTRLAEYVFRFAPLLLLLVLFFSPLSISPINLYEDSANVNSSLGCERIFAFKMPFDSNLNLDFGFVRILLYLIYFLPCTVVFSITEFILEKKREIYFKKLNYAFILSSFTIYLFCSSVCIVSNANSFAWFLMLPFYIYFLFLLSLASHLYYSFHGIFYLRSENPEYVEYRKIRDSQGLRLSIKTKFTFVITFLIVIILFAFMLLILNSYKKMFTEAVSDVGRAQAEQTAAVYDSAEGKYEKIKTFFDEQREANKYAETPFERIDIIITMDSEPVIFIENWENSSELPEFNVFAYTTGKPLSISDSEKMLTPAQARDYLKRYKNGAYKKEYVFNKAEHTCKYIYPVTLSRKAGHKLIGFAIVTYKQQVLMRQYFRTKIFVFTIITVFLYLSIIFSILLADFIFNPMLFLRKNVHKTSKSIEKILRGTAKNTSSAVKFNDTIKTKDEIKDLSLEIGEMVNLIKGIMPYVSFSTLQHAEKNGGETKSNSKSTKARDLCFLFTDIRGFTSLCEGIPPKEVVEILNHYLDIETEIILNNGGDVDKYVGDEMMAFFSGPRKEINACKAAMEIRSAMREEQKLSVETGKTYVSIGIGINTGEVIFGSVGSQTRKDFTSIGDTVNLAARLESANKAYGSKSIISESVYKKLKGMFICRELDFITVKGKTEPVKIYEILQQKAKASPKLTEIKNLFEEGLKYYREQKWEKSEKYFSECASKYNDLPSVVFLDRINHFKNNPLPKDWDGVFKMSVK
ncbi:adenylate/guanylate cyclase domain-containing protein [Treponema sp.]|uniref:adenylate/guanylate cyclase domain-containing protein n=1 Tax=Treponema sp. TaxID=166 RepID=UPI00388E8007